MEVIITQEHVAEFYRLNQALYAFVQKGLRDECGNPAVSTEKLIGSVSQMMLHYMDECQKPLPEKDTEVSDTGPQLSPDGKPCRPLTLAEIAYDRYAQFIEKSQFPEVKSNGLADVGPVAPEIKKRAAQCCDIPVVSIEPPKEDDSTLVKAIIVARQNIQHTWQRIGALMFLASQTPGSMSPAVRQELEETGSEALDYLLKSLEKYEASELKFAILLGGDYLKRAKNSLIQKTFRRDQAVGHYLFSEEIAPDASAAYMADCEMREALANITVND